jgi:hypothetical protein
MATMDSSAMARQCADCSAIAAACVDSDRVTVADEQRAATGVRVGTL